MYHVHEDRTRCQLRAYYVLQVPTTSLLRSYCARTASLYHHVLTTFVLSMFKVRPSPPRPSRPHYVLCGSHYASTTSYKFSLRPRIFLGRSASVVGTWPGVTGVLLDQMLIRHPDCMNVHAHLHLCYAKASLLCKGLNPSFLKRALK